MRTLFFLLININNTVHADNWELIEHSHNKSQGIIKKSSFGHGHIYDAFQDVPKKITVKHIFLGRLVQLENEQLQNEIMSYFKINMSSELKAALSSSGNLHNPALKPLKAMFNKAIMQTDYIKELNTRLLTHNYQVISASHEKFFIIKDNGNLFDAMVWLKVEKSPNKPSNLTGAENVPPS